MSNLIKFSQRLNLAKSDDGRRSRFLCFKLENGDFLLP